MEKMVKLNAVDNDEDGTHGERERIGLTLG